MQPQMQQGQMMQTSGGAEYCPPRLVAAACKSSLAVFEPGMVLNRKLKDRRVEEVLVVVLLKS